ncbi:hypothetical protein NFI96_026775, partial [Prochilodus magdalenae]
LKKFNLPQTLMIQFYTTIIESILTASITIHNWFGFSTSQERTKLQRIIRTAGRIVGWNLQSLQQIYTSRLRKGSLGGMAFYLTVPPNNEPFFYEKIFPHHHTTQKGKYGMHGIPQLGAPANEEPETRKNPQNLKRSVYSGYPEGRLSSIYPSTGLEPMRVGATPRAIVARLHYFHECSNTLRLARERERVVVNDLTISVYPDYTAKAARARAAFNGVRQQLRGIKDLRFGILHPARLRITYKGVEKTFTSPDEAQKYIFYKIPAGWTWTGHIPGCRPHQCSDTLPAKSWPRLPQAKPRLPQANPQLPQARPRLTKAMTAPSLATTAPSQATTDQSHDCPKPGHDCPNHHSEAFRPFPRPERFTPNHSGRLGVHLHDF